MRSNEPFGNGRDLEGDFAKLVKNLVVKPEALPIMGRWFEEMNKENRTESKRVAIMGEIAHYKQRMKSVDSMFRKARLTEEE
jgi:hypothetical protein